MTIVISFPFFVFDFAFLIIFLYVLAVASLIEAYRYKTQDHNTPYFSD